MREPLDNKATSPDRNKVVERFPQRVGRRKIHCRDLTKEEIAARGKDSEAMKKARAFRDRKAAQRGS